jgi:hypothetical protein
MIAELRHSFLVLTPFLILAFVTIPAIASQDPNQPLMAPPPLKIIPKNERTQIEIETDNKDRLKLIIQFALAHLETAERYTAQSNFEAASTEVGTYHALIESALTMLADLKRDSNRTRDLYKRLEMALRGHGPRLTAMRRITPLEFAVWIKKVEDFARDGRTEALNSFYGHTVVKEKNEPEKPSEKPVPTPKTPQP